MNLLQVILLSFGNLTNMGLTQFITAFICSLLLAIYFGFFANNELKSLIAFPIGFMIIFGILIYTSIY